MADEQSGAGNLEKPKTVEQLIKFYYDRFKPLYSHAEALNQPPVEMFFEVNAAFDHLTRKWQYGESEESVVASVAAHLKRGCFDAFKIFVKEARDQYDRLKQGDVSIINNGDFERKMLALFARIKKGATIARCAEGDSRDEESWHKAFGLWEPVYADCVSFEKNFFLNPAVEWARRKTRLRTLRQRAQDIVIGFVVGFVASLFAAWAFRAWCGG